MTTQHTHHEHSDVEENVVEHSPATETSVDSTTTNTETSAASHDEENISSSTFVDAAHANNASTTNASHEASLSGLEEATTDQAKDIPAGFTASAPAVKSEEPQEVLLETPALATVEQAPISQDDQLLPQAQDKGESSEISEKIEESTGTVDNVSHEETLASDVTTPEIVDSTASSDEAQEIAPSATLQPTSSEVEDQTSQTASSVEVANAEAVVTDLFTVEIIDEAASKTDDSHEAASIESAESIEQAGPEERTEDLLSEVAEDASTEITSSSEVEVIHFVLNKPDSSLSDDDQREAAVRPFTDFIAEFRQAEAARKEAALRETQAQADALALLGSVDTVFMAPEGVSSVSTADSVKLPEVDTVADVQVDEEQKITPPGGEAIEEVGGTLIDEIRGLVTPTLPAERAVSPLLRPATRLRVPRHGTRHQRDEHAIANNAASSSKAPASENIDASVEKQAPAAPEKTETAPAKPARRYRFDRPSSAAASSAASVAGQNVQPSPVKSATSQPAQAPVESSPAAIVQPETQAPVAPPVSEPVVKNKPVAQPEIPSESETAAPAAPAPTHSETGRRKHTKEHHTAAQQPAPAPVEPVPVAPPQPEEIAPEDLPPLEYAELQKASSRRRRRHRSGSNNAVSNNSNGQTNQPAAPVVPPALPAAPLLPSIPQIPASPRTNNAALSANASLSTSYSIVSGYTVNQMNQGNEMSGPFMGPEPSPARGSVLSRDGRTTARAESQRTPIHSTPAPANRASEGGLSSAALNQFANVISQAIQTQTDRMVAELRRANQVPTNVSVSLPPFPSTERVGVFVDVANLLYSARTLRIGVDFGKLLDFLRGNRRLVRAHAYCPTSPQAGDEQMFLQAVKGLGYRITTKNYKTFSSGAKKADLDLDLCMDVVRLVDGGAVDCIVLVSGDSDFMPMLDYCSDHGVRVEVAAFDEAMSATLRQSCDLFVNLSMLEEIRA